MDDKEANVGRSRRGRKQLQGRQEPPGARASRSRGLQEQDPLRVRTSRRENAPGRESPAIGASGEETVDAKDTEDDKEANVGPSRSGRKQLQGRPEAAADRTPEVHDPRRVFERPPAQRRGSPAVDAEQEPPGARTSSREL